MPVNKNAHDRYLIIDKCLQRHYRTWTIKDLLAAVKEESGESVCERTLKGDLQQMKKLDGYNAPIAYSARQGYHYAEPGYSIRNTPLTTADLMVLHQSLHPLKSLQGLGLADELNELINRLEQHLPVDEPYNTQVLQLEAAPNYTGIEHLKCLYKAVVDKVTLRIEYKPYRLANARTEEVHPYLLKAFNGRWYLIACNEANQGEIKNYALDRIKNIGESQTAFRPCTIDLNAYFASLIGVTIPHNSYIETIRLFISSGRAPYLLSKLIHSSQVVVNETAEGIEIELRLIVNQELKTTLLSYGPDVKVLYPDSLRRSIQKLLKKALNNY